MTDLCGFSCCFLFSHQANSPSIHLSQKMAHTPQVTGLNPVSLDGQEYAIEVGNDGKFLDTKRRWKFLQTLIMEGVPIPMDGRFALTFGGR